MLLPSLSYGFAVKNYNPDYALIIDPLIYSTYVGGISSDEGKSIVIDSSGNVYVTGGTGSIIFPTTVGAYDTSYNGSGADVFVFKLNPAGSSLVYSSFIGGSVDDSGNSLVVDSSGNAYVTGYTLSSDFPATVGAYDTSFNNTGDVFVLNLSFTSYVDIGLRVYDGAQMVSIACEDPPTASSPLHIYKDSKVYGVALVDTGDANASKVRIRTSSGTKALRKYP